MRVSGKTIITCAVTGSIHTPSMSPHLPYRPEDIAAQSIEAAEAGAAVLHLHARDPATGRPTPDPDVFASFLGPIREATDAIVNLTTGGGPGMSIEERLAAPSRFAPELCSLNMGTMNFGIFDLAARPREWLFDWEKPFLESSRSGFQSNTFEQIDTIIDRLYDGRGVRFECECYDVGHLYNLSDLARRGRLKPPFLIQFIFGVLGGIGAELDNLFLMRQTAERLFGSDYCMSCFAVGRSQASFSATCIAMGGNVRVGLEDSLYLGKGRLAKSNAEQVRMVRGIVEAMGGEVATPAEARETLQLKGAAGVLF